MRSTHPLVWRFASSMRFSVVVMIVVVAGGCSPARTPPSPVTNARQPATTYTDLRLASGGGRVVAQWSDDEECHLAVVSPPALPTPEVTYRRRTDHLGTRCGPVAVTTDAIYFADPHRVLRWKNGAMSGVVDLAKEGTWDLDLAVIGDVFYVVRCFVGTVTISRGDASGVQEIYKGPGLSAQVIMVGDSVVVDLGVAYLHVHGSDVRSLRTFERSIPRILGATDTQLALCENDAVQLLPIDGAAVATELACRDEHVVGDAMYGATFPSPAKLVRTPLAGGTPEVLAASDHEIAQVAVSTDWIIYVTHVAYEVLRTKGQLAWVKRVPAP